MIITNDEEALRVECVDVLPEEIGPLRDQLEAELKHSEEMGHPGIGLAAPQIGIAKNMAIVRTARHSVDLINCRIVEAYDKAVFEQEGCLSFPGRYEKTMRYQEVVISDNKSELSSFVAAGLLAVVIQHELDHTNGILLPDVAIKKPLLKKNKVRPNDRCPCNSGRKYKRCCSK